MIRGIMALYTDTTAIILTSYGHTYPFHVSKGILQGDTLAPFLFVLAVDWMIRRALTPELIAECGPIIAELHWLRVPERIKFRLCVLAYRCLHGTAPLYLAESLLSFSPFYHLLISSSM